MKKAKAAAGILAAGLSAAALFLTAGVRTEAAEAGMAEAPVYRTATPSQLEESIEEENPAFEEEGETSAEEPGSEEDEFGEGVRGEDAAGGGLEVVGRDGLDLGAVLLVGGDAAEGEQALSH